MADANGVGLALPLADARAVALAEALGLPPALGLPLALALTEALAQTVGPSSVWLTPPVAGPPLIKSASGTTSMPRATAIRKARAPHSRRQKAAE